MSEAGSCHFDDIFLGLFVAVSHIFEPDADEIVENFFIVVFWLFGWREVVWCVIFLL